MGSSSSCCTASAQVRDERASGWGGRSSTHVDGGDSILPSSFAQRSFKNLNNSSRISAENTSMVRVIAVRPGGGGQQHSARNGGNSSLGGGSGGGMAHELLELRKQQSGSPSISGPMARGGETNGRHTPQQHQQHSQSAAHTSLRPHLLLRQPSSNAGGGFESSVAGAAPTTRTNGVGEDEGASSFVGSMAIGIGSSSNHHQHSVSFAPISPTHHRLSNGMAGLHSQHTTTASSDRDDFGCSCSCGLNSQHGGSSGGGGFKGAASAAMGSIEEDLRRSSTFGRDIASWPTHLQAEMLSRLAAAFVPRSFCVGDLLYAESQHADAAYFVRAGFVELRADRELLHTPATVVKEARNPSSPPPMPGSAGSAAGNGSSSPMKQPQPPPPQLQQPHHRSGAKSVNSSPRGGGHRPAASIGLFSDFAGRDPGVSSFKMMASSGAAGLHAVDEAVAQSAQQRPRVALTVSAGGEEDDEADAAVGVAHTDSLQGAAALHSFSVSRGQSQSIKMQPSRRRSTGGTTGTSSVVVRRTTDGVGSLAQALQSQSAHFSPGGGAPQISPHSSAAATAADEAAAAAGGGDDPLLSLPSAATFSASLAQDTVTLATKVAGECFGGDALFHCTDPSSSAAQPEQPKLRSHYAVIAQQHTELLVLTPESFQTFLQSWEERVFALRLAAAMQLQQQQQQRQSPTAALSPSSPPASSGAATSVRRWFRGATSPASSTASSTTASPTAAPSNSHSQHSKKKKLLVKSAQGDMIASASPPPPLATAAEDDADGSPRNVNVSAPDVLLSEDRVNPNSPAGRATAAAASASAAKASAAAAAATAALPQPPSAALLRSTLLQCFGFGFAAALPAHLPGALSPRTVELVSLLFERVRLEPGHVLMREGEAGQFLPPHAPATVSPSMLGGTASLSPAVVLPITPRLGNIALEYSPTTTRAPSPTATATSAASAAASPRSAFFPPGSPVADKPAARSASMLVAGGGHLLSSAGAAGSKGVSAPAALHVREPRLYFLLEGNMSCNIRGNPSARRSKVHRIFDSIVPPTNAASILASAPRFERAHSASRSSVTATGGTAALPAIASPVPRALSIYAGNTPGSSLLPNGGAAAHSHSQGGTPIASPTPARSASFATTSAAALLSPPAPAQSQPGLHPQLPISSPRSPPPSASPRLVSSSSAEKAPASGGASLPVSVSTVTPKSASPPTFLGEMGVLLGLPRTATLRCGAPSTPTAAGHCCVLLEVRTLDRFRALLLLVPQVLAAFLGRIQLSLHLHLCHFLTSPLLAKGFVSWVSKREHSGENFSFWKATKAFRAAYSKNLLSGQRNRQSAKDILEQFVGIDSNEADTPVNLCGTTVANIMARWNRANATNPSPNPPPLETSKSSFNVLAATTAPANSASNHSPARDLANGSGGPSGSGGGAGLDADLFLEAEEEILNLMNSDSFPRFRASDVLAKNICETVAGNILGMAAPGVLSVNTNLGNMQATSSSIPPSPSGTAMPLHRGATMRAPAGSLTTPSMHHHSGSVSDARSSSSNMAAVKRSQTKFVGGGAAGGVGGATTTLVTASSYSTHSPHSRATASPGSIDTLGGGGFEALVVGGSIVQPRPSPSSHSAHHRHSRSVVVSPQIRPRLGLGQGSGGGDGGATAKVSSNSAAVAGFGPNSAGVASVPELDSLDDGICASPRLPLSHPGQLQSSTPSPKILARRGSSVRMASSLATVSTTSAALAEMEEHSSLQSSPQPQAITRPSPLPSPSLSTRAEASEERDGWLDAGGIASGSTGSGGVAMSDFHGSSSALALARRDLRVSTPVTPGIDHSYASHGLLLSSAVEFEARVQAGSMAEHNASTTMEADPTA